jgi:hypothetical protein
MLVNPDVRERFHDYLLEIDVPSAGLRDVSFSLDSDAAFLLRSWKVLNCGPNAAARIGARFRTENGTLVQSGYVSTDGYATAPLVNSYPVRRGLVVSPELMYSPQGTIRVDLANYSGETLPAKILFRGVKLFRGAGPGSYPKRMAVFPFIQELTIADVPVSGSSLQNPMFVLEEADYVFRGGVCDPGFLGRDGGPVRGAIMASGNGPTPIGGQYTNLTVQLSDGDLKPYSNVPIPINELFPQSSPYPSLNDGGSCDPATWRMGLFTPQLYVKRNEGLFLSVYRNDAPGAGLATLNFRFHGAKVYPK